MIRKRTQRASASIELKAYGSRTHGDVDIGGKITATFTNTTINNGAAPVTAAFCLF